jgi:kynurenine formamidase
MDSDTRAPALSELGALLRNLQVHDVTPVLGPDTAMFGPAAPPSAVPVAEHAVHGAASKTWTIHEHTGAHVDAPYHFDPEGLTVELLPADVLFLRPFKKFDLSGFDLQPGQPASLEQLTAAADRGGFVLETGDVAIVDFGWDKYLPGGAEEQGNAWWSANQPGLSDEACEYLAAAGVRAVASDTAACDLTVVDGEMTGGTGHTHHLLPQGILIVEGLRGLGAVPATGLFAGLPLKLAAGTASPLRVLLLTD